MAYRTTPVDTDRMPPGVPWIIGNEAAERFSFYGMRTILVVFMVQYLHLMDTGLAEPMSETQATAHFHSFVKWVYFTPLLGAFLADVWLGRYRTIMALSLVYCAGHGALACMGAFGGDSVLGRFGLANWWLGLGLSLIALGSGGIKPCVSANVGDQFGARNRHLLTRIYNWFYFSINFGSFVSTLLTPWLLEWYGPHWAFGVPGVLMALATLLFWLGRRKFVHAPPAGLGFFKELSSREGLVALAKLVPLFVFIAIFWALYDQTGSSWVFQSERMNRSLCGIEWLPSQIQAVNPVLILTYIPLFTIVLYPAAGRIVKLTPLRKIGTGFFLTAASFGIITLIQTWIDRGSEPNIAWQLLAYAIITAAEIMVSVVGLEFAYTQAPRSLKSMIMSLYLLSVWFGNHLTGKINEFIEIPKAASIQHAVSPAAAILPGYDGITGTGDDFRYEKRDNQADRLIIPGQAAYEAAAQKIEALAANGTLPSPASVGDPGKDPWGNPIHYDIIDSRQFRLISAGPDGKPKTEWDQGLLVTLNPPPGPAESSWLDRLHPREPWLARRHVELGVALPSAQSEPFTRTAFSGGQTILEGSAYYRLFMWLMLGTAVLFVPFAIIYRPKSYLG